MKGNNIAKLDGKAELRNEFSTLGSTDNVSPIVRQDFIFCFLLLQKHSVDSEKKNAGKATGGGYPGLRVDELGREKDHRGQLTKLAMYIRLGQRGETRGGGIKDVKRKNIDA